MDTPAEVDAGKLGIRDLPSGLGALAEACGEMDADFFLIGALARGVLLEHIYGTEVPLTTGDVDVAVAVESWQVYEDLRRRPAEGHGFENEPEKQRRRSVREGAVTWPARRLCGEHRRRFASRKPSGSNPASRHALLTRLFSVL
jgi:hypothetical protein